MTIQIQYLKPEDCFSIEEARKAAKEGGKLSLLFKRENQVLQNSADLHGKGEFSVHVIGSQGTENSGFWILKGLNKQAKDCLYKGKLKMLRQNGISIAVAMAAVQIPCGLEIPVAKAAEELLELYRRFPIDNEIKGINARFSKWAEGVLSEEEISSLSGPRKIAVLKILEKVVGR